MGGTNVGGWATVKVGGRVFYVAARASSYGPVRYFLWLGEGEPTEGPTPFTYDNSYYQKLGEGSGLPHSSYPWGYLGVNNLDDARTKLERALSPN